MRIDYLELGPTPCGENCLQVGNPDYLNYREIEAKAYIHQLVRIFGPFPSGCKLAIKYFPHDFGQYHEVCAVYSTETDQGVEWALNIENNLPERWDEEAKVELIQEGYPLILTPE
jgi:hypothetical protein